MQVAGYRLQVPGCGLGTWNLERNRRSYEIIKEIRIPTPPAGAKSAFIKFAIRKSIDFPIVNCAVMIGGGEPRICLNAVAAGAAAVADARPLPAAKFKVQIAKVLVKRALLATVANSA